MSMEPGSSSAPPATSFSSLPPKWVGTLDEYWGWIDLQVEASGGFLIDSQVLEVQLLESAKGDIRGFWIDRARVHFWDGTFLEIFLRVNGDLESEEYNFHFQKIDGSLIFRKDKQPGHEDEVGLCHIHDDPSDPDAVRKYPEVDLEEVFREIHDFQRESQS